jgi:hypothetical protein
MDFKRFIVHKSHMGTAYKFPEKFLDNYSRVKISCAKLQKGESYGKGVSKTYLLA